MQIASKGTRHSKKDLSAQEFHCLFTESFLWGSTCSTLWKLTNSQHWVMQGYTAYQWWLERGGDYYYYYAWCKITTKCTMHTKGIDNLGLFLSVTFGWCKLCVLCMATAFVKQWTNYNYIGVAWHIFNTLGDHILQSSLKADSMMWCYASVEFINPCCRHAFQPA